MLADKRALPKVLSKPIRFSAAPARGLRRQLGLLPDQSDFNGFAAGGLLRCIDAFDEHFGLDRNTADLHKQRLKSIIEQVYDVPANSRDWECWAFLALLQRHVLRACIVERGRPTIWTWDTLVALHADERRIKNQYPGLKGDPFYYKLRSRHPKTWGQFGISTLRRATAQAKKIARKYPEPPAANRHLKI